MSINQDILSACEQYLLLYEKYTQLNVMTESDQFHIIGKDADTLYANILVMCESNYALRNLYIALCGALWRENYDLCAVYRDGILNSAKQKYLL